jgi:hypothetical protein
MGREIESHQSVASLHWWDSICLKKGKMLIPKSQFFQPRPTIETVGITDPEFRVSAVVVDSVLAAVEAVHVDVVAAVADIAPQQQRRLPLQLRCSGADFVKLRFGRKMFWSNLDLVCNIL